MRNHRTLRRLSIGLTALAAVSITLAACSSTSTPADNGSLKGKEITVAIVPKLLGAPVFEANIKGAKQVADELKEKIVYTAPVAANGADQAQVIMGLVNSNDRPDVTAFSANDPTSLVPALKAAQQAGINVFSFDSDSTPSARSYFIQDTSYEDMGQAMIDEVASAAGEDVTYAIMSSTKDAAVQNAWIDAMKSYASATYPKMKLAGIGE